MSEDLNYDNTPPLPEEPHISAPHETSEGAELQPEQPENLGLPEVREGLGALALSGDTIELSTTPVQSPTRNTFERFLDRRADKKALKKAVADTYAYRAEKIFGSRDALSGFNNSDRKVLKSIIKTDEREGRATATEARMALGQVDALPLKLGEEMHKRTSKAQARATRRLNRAWGNVSFPELESGVTETRHQVEVNGEVPESQERGAMPSRRERITAIRDNDIELKEREQALRARELEQRERVLQLREEALARGEIIDIPLNSRAEPLKDRETAATEEYLKKKEWWDKQTSIIERYNKQPEFAGLFSETRLLSLDAAIQAEVAPKYDAALRRRIDELNPTLPDDKKWKAVDDMTPSEKEKATRRVLTGEERGNIASPIDDKYTKRYLGDKAGNRELMLALSWQRRRLAGRSLEPQPPKAKK